MKVSIFIDIHLLFNCIDFN